MVLKACKDIAIRPYCNLRQTRNTPVFIKSPESQKKSVRDIAEAEARKSQDILQLGSLGLSRSQSWSQLEARSPKADDECEKFEYVLPDAARIEEMVTRAPSPITIANDPEDSDSEADSNASFDLEQFDLESPISPWCLPEKTLKDAIKRRVNEQVMLVNLKHLTFKGQMRYGGRDSTGSNLTPAEVLFRRQAVGLKAANFTELYSDTLGILEAHMTLKPPARERHSINNAELGAYTSPLEENMRHTQSEKCASEECIKGLTRSARRVPTCPAGFSFEPTARTT